MTRAVIEQHLEQIADWADNATSENFELLARIHTALGEAAGTLSDAGQARARLTLAVQKLEPVILRDIPFDEGIADVRRLVAEARRAFEEESPAGASEASLPTGQAMAAAGAALDGRPTREKHLIFTLGTESYGIAIRDVREIVGRADVTRVPRVPEHIRGVVNLRGQIIPIIDLRRRLALPAVADRPDACIIVVDVDGRQSGLWVDHVSDVADIAATDVVPAPSFGNTLDSGVVLGLARGRDQLTVLLDVRRVLGGDSALPTREAAA